MASKDYIAPYFTTDPEERIIAEALEEALQTPSKVHEIALRLKDDLRTLRWDNYDKTPSDMEDDGDPWVPQPIREGTT